MPAFWLTYKPLSGAAPRGWPSEEMDKLVRSFEENRELATPLWRIASSKIASIGDRVYLFKQGVGRRGIFGVGELIEAPRVQTDPTDIDAGPTVRARIKLIYLVNPSSDFLLELESVSDVLPVTLIEAQQSGNRVDDALADELDRRLSEMLQPIRDIQDDEADDSDFDPSDIRDERERAIRAVRIRRGQPDFRAALMSAYGECCAISGCSVKHVLEAAHIHPYMGKLTNHTSNGLLLRSDIHTLFDCYLLAIEPEKRVVILADELIGSPYARLAGRKLRAPTDAVKGASKKSLSARFREFKKRHRKLPCGAVDL